MEAWPIPIGNAAQLSIRTPPAGARKWRICRATTPPDTVDDGEVIYEGDDQSVIDHAIVNDTLYHYAAWFTRDGTTWTGPQRASVRANPEYGFIGSDAQELVRDRLRDGLAVEVAAGRLLPPPGASVIEVFTAPPRFDSVPFPCVSVHLDSDGPAERGIGDDMLNAEEMGGWIEGDGWISRFDLTVMGWCLNPDERIALRKAIKKMIIGNFPVFAGAGLIQIDFHQRDEEDFQSYNAPIYMTRGMFTCLSSYAVTRHIDPISDVTVTAIAD